MKYWWLNEESEAMLGRGYLLDGETVEQAVDRITSSASDYLGRPELKEPFKELIEKGWMSLSSPIWSNLGTDRGLPISCFGSYIPDSIEGISDKLAEVIAQTKSGGGTSAYFGGVRPRGAEINNNGTSSGSVSFMKLFDSAMDVVSQGAVRRGAMAVYLPIDHEDIEEFLNIKSIGNSLQNLFYGVCISDEWMHSMIDGDEDKRVLWAKVLTSRQEKGLPYIFYTDNVNNVKPEWYDDYEIYASNLCSEIALPTSEDESFVCCLSSMNLELYDEWKDTDAVILATYFLDAVMSEFIDKARDKKHLASVVKFAEHHRAIGLGVLGYHAYLQKNMIAFESMEAKQFNYRVFKHLKEDTDQATKLLAEEYGEPDVMKGTGRRNATTMAVAPTTSSSSILGQTSQGIEPYASNFYKAGLAKGNFIRKNKFLEALLEKKGYNTQSIWNSIMLKGGSVQHLECLDDYEKLVFKTFKEISPMEIVIQAGQRQKFIDQSQSLNINIPPDMPVKDVNNVLIEGWRQGVKTFYYQRSESISKQLMVGYADCKSCEG